MVLQAAVVAVVPPEAGVLYAEVFRVALTALRANKLRSLLTMLGIVIGVGAVIAMDGIGRGAQSAIKARITSLGRKASVLTGFLNTWVSFTAVTDCRDERLFGFPVGNFGGFFMLQIVMEM